MSFDQDIAGVRTRIAKAESDRDHWRTSGRQVKYLESCSRVDALEIELDLLRKKRLESAARGEWFRPVDGSAGYAAALGSAIESLQDTFPGLGIEPSAGEFRITIPHALRTTHEQHFAKVLDEFLSRIGGELSFNCGPDLVAKYTLLARAAELSHRNA